VRLAKARGVWSELEAEVRAGQEALAELGARGERPDDDDVEAAARRFRYERDLLAADELDGWLEQHRITEDEWEGYLRRAAAREQLPEATGETRHEVSEGEIWCEGVCSRRLAELADDLARLAAVSPGIAVEQLDAAFANFGAAAVDAPSVAREVELNRLEWLRFTYEGLAADDEGAALEAALCIRADGEPIEAVAERASLQVLEDECWLEELDPALATSFLAAATGDVVGPISVEDGFVVVRVTSKTAPSLEDADVHARAREGALERVVERLVADRVVWR
jgi:parvulin-like peptidyl-prolyl cis-trans isomerase-like protein